MNLVTINNGLQAWFVAATGLTRVIWADQGAPRPTYPYGLLKNNSFGKVGRDEHRYLKDELLPAGSDLLDQISGNRPIIVSCQVLTGPTGSSSLAHNATAMHYLQLALTSLSNTALMDTLYAAGVAYHSNENILDLSGLVDGKFRSQANMDVHFHAVENFQATPGSYIKTTKVSGTFEGAAGSELDFTDEVFGDTT